MKITAYDALVMSAKEKNKVRKGLEMFGCNFRQLLEKVLTEKVLFTLSQKGRERLSYAGILEEDSRQRE